jgi:phenol 2-monooxygenase (NADPH)
MDVYPRTNFPDIRKKVIIKSTSGNIIIIPREGDALVRFYIALSTANTSAKDITLPQLHQKAAQILHPYKLEVAETAWWSAYVIGQRLADAFHAYNRVFLAGDACHTHSPKAGQGMNVSLQDGYNIGWKLASVLKGRTKTQGKGELLETYVLEREATARDLIEFDRYWSGLFSTSEKKNKRQTADGKEDGEEASEDVGGGNGEKGGGADAGGITPELFIKAGRYTAGLVTRYEDSIITSASTSQAALLAKNLTVGMRFPSAQVVRVCDARHMPLTRAMLADSLRWHLVVFGGVDVSSEKIQKVYRQHLYQLCFIL